MRQSMALVAIAVCLPAPAAQPRWTFCVAASKSGADVWITDVFAAERDREQLESAFRALLGRMGAARADAQCPLPREDKTEAVNAHSRPRSSTVSSALTCAPRRWRIPAAAIGSVNRQSV